MEENKQNRWDINSLNRKSSGAAKRKNRKLREEKEVVSMRNVPLISRFFKKAGNGSELAAAANASGRASDSVTASSSTGPPQLAVANTANLVNSLKEEAALSNNNADTESGLPRQQDRAGRGNDEEENEKVDVTGAAADVNQSRGAVAAGDDPAIISLDPALWGSITENIREDVLIGRQVDAEGQYWREVLRRVVAVIKFLSERGLPFRGGDELLQSTHNGSYLGILELMAQFDPFLNEHFQRYGQKGRGNTSYLSATICEEFIGLMGDKTKQAIATELQKAKYFSVIVDSTPDMSHVDQLTFVFRFVNEEGNVVERFIGFEPIHSHTGSSLADCVMKMVSDLGLDLSNCRGQAYDNASNMSGKYNGLQAHLKGKNPLIRYIPCAAHSLNLVGVNCVENSCWEASMFFDLLQALYAFCSSSTHRWNKVFTDDITLTLKSPSRTRWSCRGDSTRALCENYSKIREALQMLASDNEERRDTRREAAALATKLGKLETALMTTFWDTVLNRFKLTSIGLQKTTTDLKTAVGLLESSHAFVASLREQFAHFETSARAVAGVTQSYHTDTHRGSKRKAFADETADKEAVLSGSAKFKAETFNVIIDCLLSGLNKRLDAYRDINSRFGVLFDMDCDDTDLRRRAEALSSLYSADLDKALADELIQFRSFVSTEQDKTPANLLQVVLRNGLQTIFPNVFVALRLFLTLPVSNCEGERTFSQLKRIKNELGATMGQKRLSGLSLMAIESDLVRQLDFEDLIRDFSQQKSRKKKF